MLLVINKIPTPPPSELQFCLQNICQNLYYFPPTTSLRLSICVKETFAIILFSLFYQNLSTLSTAAEVKALYCCGCCLSLYRFLNKVNVRHSNFPAKVINIENKNFSEKFFFFLWQCLDKNCKFHRTSISRRRKKIFRLSFLTSKSLMTCFRFEIK